MYNLCRFRRHDGKVFGQKWCIKTIGERVWHFKFVLVCIECIHATGLRFIAQIIVRPDSWFGLVVFYTHSRVVVYSESGRFSNC